MNTKTLKQFIFKASRATYASGDDSIKYKEKDGSTTIEYSDGSYRYHDNYFGGEPYGGREIVFIDNKAIWMMVYYGTIIGNTNNDIYSFLIKALSNSTEDMPYRGPSFFEDDIWKYKNKFEGDVNKFQGSERIFKDTECVYEARYMGGLINVN